MSAQPSPFTKRQTIRCAPSRPLGLGAYLDMPRDAAGRHDTANQTAAKIRSAERRKCPKCERKSAMVRVEPPDRVAAYCRWCGFERERTW